MHVEPVLTANQQLVFKALGDAEAPLQVYRALEKLIDFGLVHRLESLNAFVVCDHHGDHAQHPVAFAICDSCGFIAEFVDASVQEGLSRWTTIHAFRPKRVTVELRGLCETCDEASK